ncbi:MAG: NAD(+) synthase [Bacteriovoracaceae bacterium]|nr:NAD(+) synthase [Bacteriovoracaceae bacterium]
MKIHLHQTNFTIADFDSARDYLFKIFEEKKEGLHLFPEMFLTGYPLQDICLHKQFIDRYLETVSEINKFLKKRKEKGITCLIGGLDYTMDQEGLPLQIRNVAFKAEAGSELRPIYTKRLLPNYDIFDEEKYYHPGDECAIEKINGKNIAIMICEDMWPSSMHPIDPGLDLKIYAEKKNIKVDLVVNLSASPWHIGKDQKRIKRGSEISKLLHAPFIYVNKVGGEDEILFDGGSFVVAGDNVIDGLKRFAPDYKEIEIPLFSEEKAKSNKPYEMTNTWESLFKAELKPGTPPTLNEWTDKECEEALLALRFGIQEYAKKCGFKKFLVALSGGMDSALVLTIVRIILEEGQEVEAIYMPGLYSATMSYELSFELCKNLGIRLTSLPIKFFHSAIRNSYKENFKESMEGLADENIQSRMRGALLYAHSNQKNSMVLNTSNKSEIAVGYSTLYGDSVGAISVLGDIYKSNVFTLAKYINKKFENIIPEGIITRPPSAELREGQEDSQSLPPYERLDAMLEGMLSYRLSTKDLIEKGFSEEEVNKVYGLYTRSEFKRFQFCPIIKLNAKSFGFGYRVPICKKRY